MCTRGEVGVCGRKYLGTSSHVLCIKRFIIRFLYLVGSTMGGSTMGGSTMGWSTMG